MPIVCVDLSDKEYEVLTELKNVEGIHGEKLRNLFRYYLYTIPALKSSHYALKRVENREEIEEILEDVKTAYKNTECPIEVWGEEKTKQLIDELVELNVLTRVDEAQSIPKEKFRGLFKKLLHDIATESKDMDEYIAGYFAIIQLLMEFGLGTLSKEKIRDATVLINDGWLSVYPKVMKESREFNKTRKLSMRLRHADNKIIQR
ncbi:MAG: hypothetical protein FIB08_11065 [Candidatus Methanoperedens sp.]|nr:hypothetical protein [Candidatus Methanoperedens sp.]